MQRAIPTASPIIPISPRAITDTREVVFDQQLPAWARRSNPIVRRHLGVYWKTSLPNLPFLLRAYLFQVGFVGLGFLFPVLFAFLMPVIAMSMVAIPVALFLYVRVLMQVGAMAARTVVDERRSETLDLLRTIPAPFSQVLFSKLAAALWRHVEDHTMITLAATLLSLPVLILVYAGRLPEQANTTLALALIVGLASAILRLFLEPVMMGAIGLALGAASTSRGAAETITIVSGAAYFGSLYAIGLLPLPFEVWLFVTAIVPLILPIAIAAAAFWTARRLLTRD